jgi:hypothetical protein
MVEGRTVTSMTIRDLEARVAAAEASVKTLAARVEQRERHAAFLRDVLVAIHQTARDDEKGECWTLRRWLDERGVFNDDITGPRRLIAAACAFALVDL